MAKIGKSFHQPFQAVSMKLSRTIVRTDLHARVVANVVESQLRKVLSAAQRKCLSVEDSFAHFDEHGTGRVNQQQFKYA